jgi:hypothetical protein
VAPAPNQPPGGSGGASQLPNSGQGSAYNDSTWMVVILSIAAAGIGLYAAVLVRRRDN